MIPILLSRICRKRSSLWSEGQRDEPAGAVISGDVWKDNPCITGFLYFRERRTEGEQGPAGVCAAGSGWDRIRLKLTAVNRFDDFSRTGI